MPPEVVIYTTKTCGYCVRAKMYLDRKKVAFREVDVSLDGAMRRWLVEVSGYRTVPQIFVGETSIGGCDEMIALDRAGGFEPLLGR